MSPIAGHILGKKIPRNEQAGFTLIEVLVSLGLVYLLSVLVLNVITVSAVGVRSSEHQALAYAYGASLLEEMKAYPEQYLGLGGSFCSDEAPFLTAKPEGFTAEVKVEPVASFPEIYRMEIYVCGERGGCPWEEYLVGFVRINPGEI